MEMVLCKLTEGKYQWLPHSPILGRATQTMSSRRLSRSTFSISPLAEKKSHTWCNTDKETACFDCADDVGDIVKSLSKLSMDIERMVQACASKTKVDVLDIRKFAFKHIGAMIRVDKELQLGAMAYGVLKEIMIKPEAGQNKQPKTK